MLGASPHSSEATANQMTPGDEDLPAAEAVTQRTAEQDQRGEAQGVAVDRPLQGSSVRVEAYGDARQRDVDDRGVDECQGGTENGSQQHPPPGRLAVTHQARR
jgi:hypothetical protein